ncbi:MAG: hypothetical protein ABS35_15510 [Kaistia sp. SCN 65-12]|nr:MAG: hypothetical protein ABS35_15510 [Kaistia sp. SCN 65-12]
MPRAIDQLGRAQKGGEWPTNIADVRTSPHTEDVAAQIREHCAFGRLVAYLQREDGRFEEIPPEAWNTHAYRSWFQNFFRAPATVIPRRWHPLADVPDCWLFLERTGLAAIIAPQAVAAPDSDKAVPPSTIHHVPLGEIRALPFLFLGQAIEWIAARGQPIEGEELAARWDEAECELFAQIDATGQEVQGYPSNGPRIYEPLPGGIWARMNRGRTNDAAFSPVDDSEEREDGGSVYIGDARWDGARLPTTFVLKHWPSGELSDAQASEADRGTRAKRSPQQERAMPALVALFPPDGRPSPAQYTDGEVVKLVQDWLPQGRQLPSRESILRACGRRKTPPK